MEQMTDRELLELLVKEVAELKTNVAEIKTEVAEIKTEVAEIKTEVAEIKTEVAEIKTNVAVLGTRVAQLELDMKEVKADIRALRVTQETTIIPDIMKLAEGHQMIFDKIEEVRRDQENNMVLEIRMNNLEGKMKALLENVG